MELLGAGAAALAVCTFVGVIVTALAVAYVARLALRRCDGADVAPVLRALADLASSLGRGAAGRVAHPRRAGDGDGDTTDGQL